MTSTQPSPSFIGIGVGPGEPGLLSVIAWEALQQCDLIYVPRAATLDTSIARQCLPPGVIPDDRFREIAFTMDPDRTLLAQHYRELAATLAAEIGAGKKVAYLTIGDALTYSTYIYTLSALLALLPGLAYRTFPGVTSYSALAAAADWPLGEGKERLLVLPCPNNIADLRAAIEANDLVVLMKIGKRFPQVLALLEEMGIAAHCAYGRRVGMPEGVVSRDLSALPEDGRTGYLSTLLIRKTPRISRTEPLFPELP